jgi:anti-repressor protein
MPVILIVEVRCNLINDRLFFYLKIMELIKFQESKFMSSKKIAERTNKMHGHVIRDIKNMLQELKIDNPKMDDSDYQEVTDERGYTSEILLNERLSLCLASGYSISLRMMIIDDWAEMKKPKELSKKEILLIALEAEERAELAESKLLLADTKIKVLEPKAEFYDIVVNTDSAFDFGQAAKMMQLGIGRNTLLSKLRGRKILDSQNVPYQKYISAGYFEIKQKDIHVGDNVKIHIQARFTEKGIKWVIQNKQQLQ